NPPILLAISVTKMLDHNKYKYGNRHFWCRGYYVDTVGKNAKKIQEYIQNQLKEDLEYDQMTLKEYVDPFTGEPVKQNK
ncbi:MAG: transposase, partial [Blautia sp.]